MKKFDYFLTYSRLAPLQLSLIRFREAYLMGQVKMPSPRLDIGCGDGVFGQVLFKGKEGAIEVGVEINESALALARKKRVYRKIVKADARDLPLAKEKFGTVFSNQTLEHIEEVEKVFKEVARVLKMRGLFVFLVPTVFLADYWLVSAAFRAAGLKRVGDFFHQWRNKIFAHHNLWPVEIWQKKLEKAGFRLESFCYSDSKKIYFLSEFFWPLRLAEMAISKLWGRPVLLTRQLALWLAKPLKSFLENDKNKNLLQGPTMLIVARKKG